MENYKKQALDFLEQTKTKLEIKKANYQTPPLWVTEDEDYGIKYDCQLKNARGVYVFEFWDSIKNKYEHKPKPNAYSVLSAISSQEPDRDYYNFCKYFGYPPNKMAEQIHKAVLDQWENLNRIFTPEELEKLSEIQ